MARQARGEVIDPSLIQLVHGIHRCVRRAFLCGEDPLTGRSFDHRRDWIRDRLEFLASVFAIDCLTFSVMSNHVHQILRARPDIAASWSDRQVAARWLKLHPVRRNQDGSPATPTREEIDAIVNDPEVLAERRRRLSDVSWWMRSFALGIACQANREDGVKGHFWESRYKAQLLLDEAAVLACAAYVDLNPVRAAVAATPEESRFTGVKERIDDLAHRPKRSRVRDHRWERSVHRRRSGWMGPVEIDERRDPVGEHRSLGDRRASDKGFLPLSLTRYLQLIDWTGRQIRKGSRGRISEELAPILERIGIDPTAWCELVCKFGRSVKRAAGRRLSMNREAARRDQSWLQGSAAIG
jgi:hypothetical protein